MGQERSCHHYSKYALHIALIKTLGVCFISELRSILCTLYGDELLQMGV